jgi:uncharacterized membrane protein YqjE
MCYSLTHSYHAFFINLVTCYILYNYSNDRDKKIVALLLGFVGLMQLFDIIFWSNQNMQDEIQAKRNYITTKIAMFANHLQPIVFAVLIYVFTNRLGKISNNIIIIYAIAISFYTFTAYQNIKYTLVENTHVGNSNKIQPALKWEWNLQNNCVFVYSIFLLTLCILSYENFKYPLNVTLSFISVFTFALSTHFYKSQFEGRFWCKIAAYIPLIFLIIQK